MKINALSLQSLFDLAIQTGGSAESVFDLAVVNDRTMTGRIEPGAQIEYFGMTDRKIVAYYQSKNLKPATYENQKSSALTGIGSMVVEENFIIA